nr:11S globulin precursor [Tanacetum cinerariifolium]
MQESGERGLIVKVQQPMQFVTPEEEQQQWQPRQQKQGQRGQHGGGASNGLEEKICSSKILYNLDTQREADIFSRQAGKLNMVNEHKLPILSYLDLSAQKGHLQQNALISPHWSINSHTIIYVLRGDAQVQVVSNNGEAVLDEQVNRGDLFVVPQFFATTARAGQNGFEWVAFKTNKSPMKSPVAGYTSVFRAMPLEVITNSYEISPSQAQNLKTKRETESILLSPQWTGQQRS